MRWVRLISARLGPQIVPLALLYFHGELESNFNLNHHEVVEISFPTSFALQIFATVILNWFVFFNWYHGSITTAIKIDKTDIH